MKPSGVSRRSVLKTASLAAAGAVLPAVRTRALQTVAPSEKVIVGVVGCNGMGFSDLQSMLLVPGVECGALCDVDRRVLERRAAELEKTTGKRPRLYDDYRELLDDRDVDAVIIGTPDHWHCLIMVAACEAGKDVYVEKPLANSIAECGLMVAAAERYDRIVQVGQWQRSGPHWQNALDYVQSGKLGRIRLVRAWAYMDWMREIPVKPDGTPPEGVDYDFWLGPAPKRPFNPNRFHFNFRWYWDYAGGLMTDWGVHLIDMVLAGMNATAPRSVLSSGGKFAYPDDAMETPDTQQAIYDFGDFSMVWEHAVGIGLGPFQRGHGVAFVGNDGTLVVDREQWEIYPETSFGGRAYKIPGMPTQRARPGERGLDQHTENFIACIRSREQPACPPATGALAARNAHLGNIALRTGARLEWDAEAGRFRDHDGANALLVPDYRSPWELPRV